MTERAIPPRRRSVIQELETTSLAVLAADEAHLQGLWDREVLELPAKARRLRRPAGYSLTGLANRRPDLETAA